MKADLYTKLLGIPPGHRPPRPHVLLGLPDSGNDETGIEDAAKRQMDRLDRFALSPDPDVRAHVQEMMNAVAQARNVLLEQHRANSPAPQRDARGKAEAPARQELASPEPDSGTGHTWPAVSLSLRKRIRPSLNIWLIAAAVLFVALLLIPVLFLPSGDDAGIETTSHAPPSASEDPVLAARAKVEGQRERQKRQFAALLSKARQIVDSLLADTSRLITAQKTDLQNAIEVVREALDLKPDHVEVLALKKTIEACFLAPAKELTLALGGGVNMELVLIPAGKFLMGSPRTEKGQDSDESPQREVTISKPFYVGVTEVTQSQWKALMGTEPWSGQTDEKSVADRAASRITWNDAAAFCRALSEKSGRSVRLPTEAEWEYACRAGSKTRFYYGDDASYAKLGNYAWHTSNVGGTGEAYAHAVARKNPNAWGLYDMHGNVWEWCRDWYAGSYAKAESTDPKGPSSGLDRVHRGGSWITEPMVCRSASRSKRSPGSRSNSVGLRVVVYDVPAQPVPAIHAKTSGEWIDVLKLVDVEKHRIKGTWKRVGFDLQSGPAESLMAIPVTPQGNYELSVHFTRTEGTQGLRVLLAVGQRGVTAVLGNPGGFHGLAYVNNKGITKNSTGIHGELINGKTYSLNITVHTQGDAARISMCLDGKQIVNWKGKQSSLKTLPKGFPLSGRLVLATPDGNIVVFTEVTFRMLSGEAKVLGDAASPSVPKSPVKETPATRDEERKLLTLELGNGVAMRLVLIPAGKFLMGSPKTETGQNKDEREGPQHEVTISKAFYMGLTEVTQEQYASVIGKNPSEFSGRTNPVEQVSWNEAVEFCRKLSQKTGKTVRLPTEAEWEYACRAGSKTRFHFGDADEDLGKYAWYKANSNKKTHPVGKKKPNAWGLYDMYGNVREWCADWYADSYANAKPIDPQGPDSGSLRVLRGGGWIRTPAYCRSADRDWFQPVKRRSYDGFRVVVSDGPAEPAPIIHAKKPGEWIDVLKLVDVEKHHVLGTWKRAGSALHVSMKPGTNGVPRVMIPIAPQGSYELRLKFIRKSGKCCVGFILPVGRSAVALVLSRDNGAYHGLQLIKGKSKVGVRPGTLVNGREYSVAVTVLVEGGKANIAVDLGNKQIIHWQGLNSSLSLAYGHRLPNPACLRVSANSPTVFKEAKLRMLSGEAKVIGEETEKPGEAGQRKEEGKLLTLNLGSDVAMRLVLIPAGKFLMGSPETETGRREREGPQREVTISKPFYMGVYEVTQEQYASITGKNPSTFSDPTNPVEMVSWNEAVEFCRKLSQKTGKTVRLPTEAEWEYACRAGSKTRFFFGDTVNGLASYAWYGKNSNKKTHPVGRKKANAWGLYDMIGNVREWCADPYTDAKPVDPKRPNSDPLRVLRGGGCSNSPVACLSAHRNGLPPDYLHFSLGFRVVVSLEGHMGKEGDAATDNDQVQRNQS